jgi:serine/threonine protein kinase
MSVYRNVSRSEKSAFFDWLLGESMGGLNYLHMLKIYPRDMKPQNFRVRMPERRLVFIDFGFQNQPLSHWGMGKSGFHLPTFFSANPFNTAYLPASIDFFQLTMTFAYMLDKSWYSHVKSHNLRDYGKEFQPHQMKGWLQFLSLKPEFLHLPRGDALEKIDNKIFSKCSFQAAGCKQKRKRGE